MGRVQCEVHGAMVEGHVVRQNPKSVWVKIPCHKKVLDANGNVVKEVYYKLLEGEDADDEGTVKYWGDFSKQTEDDVTFMGTTIPTFLYIGALVLIVIGIVLIAIPSKKEEGLEE